MPLRDIHAASRGFSRNQTKRRKRKQSLSRPAWKAFSRFSCAVLRHHIEKKGNPIVLSLRHLLLLMRNLRSRGRRRFLSAGAYRASLRRCLLLPSRFHNTLLIHSLHIPGRFGAPPCTAPCFRYPPGLLPNPGCLLGALPLCVTKRKLDERPTLG